MRWILAGFLIVLLAESALACSCDRLSTKDRYSKARGIFIAGVAAILPLNPSDTRDVVRARIEVSEVLKGNPGLISFVESGVPRGPDCNLYLREGISYLFVISDDNFVSECSSVRLTGLLGFPYQEWLTEYRALRDQAK